MNTMRDHPMAPLGTYVSAGPEGYYYSDFAEEDEIVEVVVDEGEKKKSKDKSGKHRSSTQLEPFEISLVAWTFKKAKVLGVGTKPTWENAVKDPWPFSTEELAQHIRKHEMKSRETPVQAYNALTPFQQEQMKRLLKKQKDSEIDPNAVWTFASIRKDMNPRKNHETLAIHVILKRQDKRDVRSPDVSGIAGTANQARPILVGQNVENIYEPLESLSVKDRSGDAKRSKKDKNAAKQSQENIFMAPDPPNGPTDQHAQWQIPQDRMMQPPRVVFPPPLDAQPQPQPSPPVQAPQIQPQPQPHFHPYPPAGPPQDPRPPYERQHLPPDPVTNPFAPGFIRAPSNFGTPPIARPNVEIPPGVHQNVGMPPGMREAQPLLAPQPEPNLNPPYPADRVFVDQPRAVTMPNFAQDRRPEQHQPNYSRNQPGMNYGEKVQEWDADSFGRADSEHWRDHSSNEGAENPSTPSTSMSPEPYGPPQERGYHGKYGHHGRHDSGYQGNNNNNNNNHHPGTTMHPIRTPRHEENPRHNAPTQRYAPTQVHQQQPQPRPQDDREHDRDLNRDRAQRPDRYDARSLRRQRQRRSPSTSPPPTPSSSSPSHSSAPTANKTSYAIDKIMTRLDDMAREKREAAERARTEAERNEAYVQGRVDERREREREQEREFFREREREREQQHLHQQRPPLLHSQSLGAGFEGAYGGGYGGGGHPSGYSSGGGGRGYRW